MIIDCSNAFLGQICEEVGIAPTEHAQSIACIDDSGSLIAGVVYDHYNGHSITASIYVNGRPLKTWYHAIFNYPFNDLGVVKILVQVADTNTKSCHLAEHMDFTEQARLKDFYEDGDMIMYILERPDCRILNNSLWGSMTNKAEAA